MRIEEIKFIQEGESGYPELQMLLNGEPHSVALDTDPTLELSDIEYQQDQGRNLLSLKIDGTKALISLEQKPTLIKNGIISVGWAFEDLLPPIRLVNPAESMDIELKGCSNDPNLIKAFIEFADAVTG